MPVQIRLDNGIVPGTNAARARVFNLDRVEVLKVPPARCSAPAPSGGRSASSQAQPSLTESSGYARAGIGTTDDGGASYEMSEPHSAARSSRTSWDSA